MTALRTSPPVTRSSGRKLRVLIVDDSALARKIIAEALGEDPDIEIAGWARDGFTAGQQVRSLKPDVVTLDLEMPGMDGLTFLRNLKSDDWIPAVVVSAVTGSGRNAAFEALRAGAVEVITKPSTALEFTEFRSGLPQKVRAAAESRKGASALRAGSALGAHPLKLRAPTIVAIGSSTGGTEAVEHILRELPEDSPGIVIAQHIPARFSLTFAERLRQVCRIHVKEAASGDIVSRGLALIAPGDQHLAVKVTARGIETVVYHGPRVGFQRPSVNVLFHSVAIAAGPCAIGVILTGMGNDGAEGMLEMKRAGAVNLAQNEATCAVFGMPREAIRAGAVDYILPLPAIAATLSALHARVFT
jgi:two-component system chemotaxis response regulator CheB